MAEGHSRRVTDLSVALAGRFGIAGSELDSLRRGALLHDIGKMGVPDSVLLKPGPLSEEEFAIMKRHPVIGRELLVRQRFLDRSLDIPYYHHEKWDGSGYPCGLAGEAIPLPARLFAIIDVWDALRSDRPYRKAWPAEKVLEHVASLSGSHFDPEVVREFTAMQREALG
jgi:putative nucleotidyltransferase with HDIG domain